MAGTTDQIPFLTSLSPKFMVIKMLTRQNYLNSIVFYKPKCPFNCIPGHLGALCAAALAARVEAEYLAAEDALRLAVAQPAPLHHLHTLHQAPAM